MRKPKISSLFGQIFFIFWSTLLVILLIVLTLPNLDPRTQQDISESRTVYFSKINKSLTKYYQNQDLNLYQLAMVNAFNNRKYGSYLFIADLQGNLISTPQLFSITQNKRDNSSLHAKIESIKAVRNFISLSDNPLRPLEKIYRNWIITGPFKTSFDSTNVLLYFAQQQDEQPYFFMEFLDQPLRLLIIIMIISTPLLLWLSWKLSIPARQLHMAANRVALGEFNVDPYLESGPAEFQQAGESFNQMVTSLNQMMNNQQRLLSDISHELRSPLTRLRMATALAKRKKDDSSELKRIDLEAERLETMIADLLKLSKMQNNSHQDIQKTTADMIWLTILNDAQFEAEQLGKILTYTGLKPYMIKGNINLLRSAIENVIRNAIKYSNNKIQIIFKIDENNNLEISVDDDGVGVSKEELNMIFKPFYRISTARDRDSGGTGLGLAITESAILQHQGKIEARTSKLGGLQILIYLPIA